VYDDRSTPGRDLITHQLHEAEEAEFVWNAVIGPLEVVKLSQAPRLLALYSIKSK